MFSTRRTGQVGRHRRAAIAVAAVCAAGSLSSCAVANSQSVIGGSTVRIVLSQEPPTLEPCESSLTSTGVVVRSNITEPLIERDPGTGELEPLLATAWEQTTDRTWTFTMREGVTFSDGEPFDAKAAAFSIDRAVNGDLACNVEGYVFGDTDLEVEAVDATTLTVTTPQPDPILPLRISFIEIVPPSTSTTEKVREPVGTGPFLIERWDAGQRLVLDRNPDYWGEQPDFEHASYVWRAEGSVRAAMVINGEADIATGLGPEDGAGDNGISYPNNETVAVRMQLGEAPLNDFRVRQAINYAVDREGIVAALFGDLATPAAQLVPTGIVGHNDALEPWPYDPDKARELLAEAEADGVDLSPEIRLIARTAQYPKIDEVVQVVQQELADIGLNVRIQMMDTAAQLEYQLRPFPEDTGPYLLMIQHGNQAGDAAFSLDQYELSNGPQSSGGTEEFDTVIRDAEALTDDARQDALAEVFAEEPETIGQFAYIAHQTGVLGIADRVDYEPTSATGDEMHLADMGRED